MKILQTRTAPNPRRVRIFLAEKGIEVPYEEVDLMKGDLKTPEFTRLNWFQRVPVLILDDGAAVAETMAICRYFEETQPEPALFGKGALGRASVEMWNRRMELGLLLSVAQAFRHLHPAMAHLEVRPGARPTSPGRSRSPPSWIASWQRANSSPATSSRSPTSRRWCRWTS